MIPFDFDVDSQCEEQFDTEFEELIKNIDIINASCEIPDDLDLDEVVNKLKTEEVLTPFQDNVNNIIDNLNKAKYKEFCSREFKVLKGLMEKNAIHRPCEM